MKFIVIRHRASPVKFINLQDVKCIEIFYEPGSEEKVIKIQTSFESIEFGFNNVEWNEIYNMINSNSLNAIVIYPN